MNSIDAIVLKFNKQEGVREANSIHLSHLTLRKPESLKDHWSSRFLNVFESFIVVDLFISL